MEEDQETRKESKRKEKNKAEQNKQGSRKMPQMSGLSKITKKDGKRSPRKSWKKPYRENRNRANKWDTLPSNLGSRKMR
jgi:hypothetical protein